MDDQQQVSEEVVSSDSYTPVSNNNNADIDISDDVDYIDTSDDPNMIDISDDSVSFEDDSTDDLPIQEAIVDSELEYPDLPKEQQDAFTKRLQREQTKLEEKFQQQLEDHQNAILMGNQYGWDKDQINMYIQEQQLQRNDFQKEVDWHINKLAEDSSLTGIKDMRNDISALMWKNPNLTVRQAYNAVLPDSSREAMQTQLQREIQQREAAKRSQVKRTVVADSPTDMRGPEPLTTDAVEFMRRTGFSEDQVRMMSKEKGPKNLQEYREMMKKRSK